MVSAECHYGWFGFCSCNPSRFHYRLLSDDTVLSPVSTPQCAEPAQSALIPIFWKLQQEIPCWYDAGCRCSHMANVQTYGHKCIYSLSVRKRNRAIDSSMEKYAKTEIKCCTHPMLNYLYTSRPMESWRDDVLLQTKTWKQVSILALLGFWLNAWNKVCTQAQDAFTFYYIA